MISASDLLEFAAKLSKQEVLNNFQIDIWEDSYMNAKNSLWAGVTLHRKKENETDPDEYYILNFGVDELGSYATLSSDRGCSSEKTRLTDKYTNQMFYHINVLKDMIDQKISMQIMNFRATPLI